MKKLALVLLLVLSWPLIALPDFATANKLLQMCERESTQQVCLGYLAGVADAMDKSAELASLKDSANKKNAELLVDTSFCIPAKVTTGQLRWAFLEWAKKTGAALLNQGASLGVKTAFVNVWPCAL